MLSKFKYGWYSKFMTTNKALRFLSARLQRADVLRSSGALKCICLIILYSPCVKSIVNFNLSHGSILLECKVSCLTTFTPFIFLYKGVCATIFYCWYFGLSNVAQFKSSTIYHMKELHSKFPIKFDMNVESAVSY